MRLPDEHPWATFRELAKIFVPFLALLAAAATLFLTVLLKVDDVRVAIGSPSGAYKAANGSTEIVGKQQFTFINSGTRSVAITYYDATGRRIRRSGDNDCNAGNDRFPVMIQVAGFILKPGELIIHSAETGGRKIGNDGTKQVPLFDWSEGNQYLICLNVELITPDSVKTSKNLPIFRVKIVDNAAEFTRFDENPIVLLPRTYLWH